MKKLLTLIFFQGYLAAHAQSPAIGDIDSLKNELKFAKRNTNQALLLNALSASYSFLNTDSAFEYGRTALKLSQDLGFTYGQYLAFQGIFFSYMNQGEFPKALSAGIESMKAAEQLPNRRAECLAKAHMYMGIVYRITAQYPKVLEENRLAFQAQKESGKSMLEVSSAFTTSAIAYLNLDKKDSAAWLLKSMEDITRQNLLVVRKDSILWDTYLLLSPTERRAWSITFGLYSSIQEKEGNLLSALRYLQEGINHYSLYTQYDNKYFLMRLYINLAKLMYKMKNTDSSIYYGAMAAQISRKNNFLQYELEATKFLAQVYEDKKEPDSVVKYLRRMISASDSVYSQTRVRQFQSVAYTEEQRVREIEAAKERYRVQLRSYAMLTALVIFLAIAFILYRNNRQKQKAYIELGKQKKATDVQKAKAEMALTELKSTQAQLIQSEKMASLGEMTAGIAHEIQNPLNFVNNFSEVNKELIVELREQLGRHKMDLTAEDQIMSDLEQNLEKINLHGKRADAIVKSMLEHSRFGSGEEELADFNALADECSRISYHSFRAADKNFNVAIKTHFDPQICEVRMVKEDLGKVLLNLFNNAFYSVNTKRKNLQDGDVEKQAGYEPKIEISTMKADGNVKIRIRDNGLGIPEKIIDKIYQPFFTTKPTGQGTGLGLSLSYDIVVKEHGGNIQVESREGEYAEFLISIAIPDFH